MSRDTAAAQDFKGASVQSVEESLLRKKLEANQQSASLSAKLSVLLVSDLPPSSVKSSHTDDTLAMSVNGTEKTRAVYSISNDDSSVHQN